MSNNAEAASTHLCFKYYVRIWFLVKKNQVHDCEINDATNTKDKVSERKKLARTKDSTASSSASCYGKMASIKNLTSLLQKNRILPYEIKHMRIQTSVVFQDSPCAAPGVAVALGDLPGRGLQYILDQHQKPLHLHRGQATAGDFFVICITIYGCTWQLKARQPRNISSDNEVRTRKQTY